jgi:H+/gluconate symporter-like permease
VAGGVGLVVFGIIVLMASFFMNSYTKDSVSQCGEWYGQLGQMIDPETSQNCQNASMMQAASQAGIIIGIILVIIGIVCLGVGLARTKSPSQKLDEKKMLEKVEKKDSDEYATSLLDGGILGDLARFTSKKLSKSEETEQKDDSENKSPSQKSDEKQ